MIRIAPVAGLLLLLSACGGGGGGGGDVAAKAVDETAPWRPEWASPADAKIRPGVRLTPIGCTSAFLFVDPVSHRYYLSTADHCTLAADGGYQGIGTRVGIEDFGEVGTVVLDSESETHPEHADFALIELDPGMNLAANPQVFGLDGPAVVAIGPTGYRGCNEVQSGEAFAWHGYLSYLDNVGEPSRARQGTVNYCLSRSLFGTAPAYKGDSGAATLLIETGEAMGLLVAFSSGGGIQFTPMDRVFEALAQAGFGAVALATIDGNYVHP